MHTSWDHRYAHRTAGMTSSFIRELLKVTAQPDVISFGGGFPAAELFPLERVKEACEKVLTENGAKALQYSQTEGYAPLREIIASNVSRYGIKVSADNVLITTGSQQALDIIGRIFINRGDRVLTESPTYLGALQAWNAYGAVYETVISDDDGLCTDNLARVIGSHIKFMYILPNFQNPAGVTLSRERRHELIHLAQERGIPILEDDPYGELRYEGEAIEPLVAIDAQLAGHNGDTYTGNVISLGTFSKTLAPGLRIAWIVAPKNVISKLTQLKQGADLHTSTFNQMVIYEVARDEFIDEHVAKLRVVYRKRRDAMLGALDRYMPAQVEWTHPDGGLFLWVQLPDGMPVRTLFDAAVRRNVAFVPGDAFFTGPNPPPTARLNFSTVGEDLIIEGIRRLSEAIEEVQASSVPVSTP